MDFKKFEEYAAQGNLVPVYREKLADLETPVSVLSRVADGKVEAVGQGDCMIVSRQRASRLAPCSFLSACLMAASPSYTHWGSSSGSITPRISRRSKRLSFPVTRSLQ